MCAIKMKKLMILGVLTAFFSGCCADFPHVEAAHKFSNKFTSRIEKKYDIICHGSGGAMVDNIKQVITKFTCYEKVNVDQARYMFVNIMEQYLLEINQDLEIRPYLEQYPVPIEGYGLSIAFVDSHYQLRSSSNVTYVFLTKQGYIIYDSWDDEKNQFELLCKEPYSEAYEKVFGKPWTGVSKNLGCSYAVN